ncbi:ATP synthase subunit delta, mitochondrial isoform X2 [Diaphorina citri]|uniref:ATP synthase F(1) complex subunit delta, mitochondrial n=1 Tax=Diaphorina citri TaxID=121845 RepID=A0A3Q0J2R9_DIACI|nr:ATP synthase subunit delta, mitochondrial isoform X2 [Diaphorina citri]
MASLMKSSRMAARLVTSATRVARRGYADQMDFTLASGNKVFYTNQNVKQVSSRMAARLVTSATRLARRGYADQMDFTLASGNKVFYTNQNVKQVDVPSFSGAFGILPNHVPTLAILKPGVITVYETEGASQKIFVSSGTITVNDDSSVQIIAEEAHPVDSLDASAARDVLSKAQSELSSASSETAKAEAQIAVEVAEALVAAAS